MYKLGSKLQQRRSLLARRASLLVPATLSILVTGCDNIKFGGLQVRFHGPTFERADTAEVMADTVAAPPLVLPTGPVIFHARRTDAAGRATIEPIAAIIDGELTALAPRAVDRGAEYASEFFTRYYQADQAYALYRDSSAVGTFYVGSPVEASLGICPALLAEGHLELRPGADTLSEFLAWPRALGPRGGSFQPPATRPEMGSLAQILAQRGIGERVIAGNWRIGRPADLRAIRVGTGPLGLAATFTVGDSLGQGSPAQSAGMVFLVADFSSAVGYFPLYFDAAWYRPGDKRSLRWIGASDVVGDSAAEWVLRAYGDATTWYEVVGQRDTTRTVVWSSRRPECEAREAAAAEVAD